MQEGAAAAAAGRVEEWVIGDRVALRGELLVGEDEVLEDGADPLRGCAEGVAVLEEGAFGAALAARELRALEEGEDVAGSFDL